MNDTTLDKLVANPDNPRTITPDKAKALKRALAKYGDLGSVVYNRKTGHVVGGHQRLDALKADPNGRLDISTRFQTPTKTGTVAEGVIFANGERYGYREVEWDTKTEKAAAIACNSSAGAWDMTGLTSWLNELNTSGFDMSLTMLSDDELMPYLPDAKDLSLSPPVATGPQPEHADGAISINAETPMGVEIDDDRDTVPVNHVKAVQLFFDEAAYKSFIECADSLREVYKKDNLSETVLEAVRRASISAAIN
jgi:hypothetical protein